ncbi:MAG: hypothetical protein J3R72DRAFT_485810 [Linnemannia gamsii]|nr:MAG: hypothetical protein J3R72DRAFT_485810 [Linnemannia gamsii]
MLDDVHNWHSTIDYKSTVRALLTQVHDEYHERQKEHRHQQALTQGSEQMTTLYKFSPLKELHLEYKVSCCIQAIDTCLAHTNTLTTSILTHNHRSNHSMSANLTNMLQSCPQLESFEAHGSFHLELTWTPLIVGQQQPLALQFFSLNSTKFKPENLENLVDFTPSLKELSWLPCPRLLRIRLGSISWPSPITRHCSQYGSYFDLEQFSSASAPAPAEATGDLSSPHEMVPLAVQYVANIVERAGTSCRLSHDTGTRFTSQIRLTKLLSVIWAQGRTVSPTPSFFYFRQTGASQDAQDRCSGRGYRSPLSKRIWPLAQHESGRLQFPPIARLIIEVFTLLEELQHLRKLGLWTGCVSWRFDGKEIDLNWMQPAGSTRFSGEDRVSLDDAKLLDQLQNLGLLRDVEEMVQEMDSKPWFGL